MKKYIILISVVITLLLAAACASTTGEAKPTTASSATPIATTSEQTITITGVVMDVSRSARIIMLTEPVQGFNVVALTEETEILTSSGGKATLQEITQGMSIQASGKPGASGAILANKVLIVQVGST